MKKFWMTLTAAALVLLLAVPALAAQSGPAAVEAQVVAAGTAAGSCVLQRPAGITDEAWAGYEWLIRGSAPKLSCAEPAALQLTFETDGIYVRSAGEMWHCICGANGTETHIGDCDGYAHKWEPWSIASKGRLPSTGELKATPRYYYLADEGSEFTVSTVNASLETKNYNAFLYFDLNGKTIKGPKAGRIFTCFNNKVAAEGVGAIHAVFTDSSVGHTGKFVNASDNWTDWTQMFWTRHKAHSMAFYRLKLDASNCTRASGTTVMSNSGTLKMFNTEVRGGKVFGSKKTEEVDGKDVTTYLDVDMDAAVTLDSSGTLVLEGCTIYGGKGPISTNGACLRVTGGTATITNCTFYGGEVKSGGAVCVSGGSVTMTNCTVSGGTVSEGGLLRVTKGTLNLRNINAVGVACTNGGVVYQTGGTVKMYSGTLTGATVTQKGGTAYQSGGNFYLYGGTITDGKANVEGGNIYIAAGAKFYAQPESDTATATRTIQNGEVTSATVSVYGGNIRSLGTLELNKTTLKGGRAVYEGSATKYAHGGNLYASGTIKLTNGTRVEGGSTLAKQNGKNGWAPGGSIYLPDGGNMTVSNSVITGGVGGNGDGHNIYIGRKASVTVQAGSHIINTTAGGVSVRMQGGSLSVTGGKIENRGAGTSNIGANENGNATISISGGEIFAGPNGSGRNLYLRAGTTATISGGKIYGGSVDTGDGGNIWLEDTCAGKDNAGAACTHSGYGITISGGEIYGGTAAAGNGGNIYAGDSKTITLTGGKVYGGSAVNGGGIYADKAAVVVSGNPQVTGNTGGNLYLREGEKLTLAEAGLTQGAKLGITCEKGAVVFTGAAAQVDAAKAFTSDNVAYMVAYDAEGLSLVAAASASGAALNGTMIYGLADAVSACGTGDWVQLLSDGDSLSVDRDLYLDLNGHSLSKVTVAAGKTLYLFDSTAADYTVGTGKVLAVEGEGKVERAFTTGGCVDYGHNYRFLVIKDAKGVYTAHRIYLTVKSTVLYPKKPALNYRTVLRCDSVVASYINNGGAYGLRLSAENYNTIRSNYVDGENAVLAAGVDNDKISQLQNILSGGYSLDKQKLHSETDLNACAYIRLTDSFGDQEVTSSTVTKSFKDVVMAIDGQNPTTLSVVQKAALGDMYTAYATLMATWKPVNISSQAYTQHQVQYYCTCGNESSEDNPCAASDHRLQAWQPWTSTTSLPTTTGNYYLTAPVTMSGHRTVAAGQLVCIDTRGHGITVSDDRMYNVYGTLNISNSTTKTSVLQAKGHLNNTAKANGGVLLIMSGANVSLYEGITLCAPADNNISHGLLDVGGDLNIYGARIEGAEVTGTGGAIRVNAGGYLFMNRGVVTGSKAARGGAICSEGTVEICGSAKISGGTSACTYELKENSTTSYQCKTHGQGGTVYVGNGTFTIDGADVSIGGGHAGLGGAICVTKGTLELKQGKISGGKAYPMGEHTAGRDCGYGGTVYIGASATFRMTGGTITGGNAVGGSGGGLGGNLFAGGLVQLLGGTIEKGTATTGGNIGTNESAARVTLDGVKVTEGTATGSGGNLCLNVRPCRLLEIKGDTQILDGTAKNGGNIAVTLSRSHEYSDLGLVRLGQITLSGVTISGGTATTAGGNFYLNGGADGRTEAKDDYTYTAVTLDGCTVIGGQASLGTGNNIHLGANGSCYINGGSVINTVDTNPTDTTAAASNIYVAASSSVEITGGTVKLQKAAADQADFRNTRNLTIEADASVTLAGGTISDGRTHKGGNIYSDGTLLMKGGCVENGKASDNVDGECGGNIYINNGTFTMESGVVSGGMAYRGGNVHIAGGVVVLQKPEQLPQGYTEPQVIGGIASVRQGGNFSIASTARFDMRCGTVSDGVSADIGGNIYTNSPNTLISGGTITNGVSAARNINYNDKTWTGGSKNASSGNVANVNGQLHISGGLITGGVISNSNGGNEAAKVHLSGAAQVTGTGIQLLSGQKKVNGQGVQARDEAGNLLVDAQGEPIYEYHRVPSFSYESIAAMDADKAEVVVRCDAFRYPYLEGICLVARPDGPTDAQWSQFKTQLDGVLKVGSDQNIITFEADGAWLRPLPAAGTRYSCACGANEGEAHMGQCYGFQVLWSAWDLGSKAYLPNMPGNWYLTNSESTSKTFQMTATATIQRDYYYNASGELRRVWRFHGLEGEAVLLYYDDGNKTWLELTDAQLLQDFAINIDMNGYTVKSPQTGRAFSGLDTTNATVGGVSRKYERLGRMHLSICDSSQGHTGAMKLHDQFNSSTVPQGCVLWLPKIEDKVDLYYLNMDGSAAKGGYGIVITTEADMNLYGCTLVGGVAQGYTYSTEHDSLLNPGTKLVVNDIKGSINGGGVLAIASGATVNMYGGSITGGTSIYRYMSGDNGANTDCGVGGGNVFVSNGTFRVDGTQMKASITGGRALAYTGDGNTAAEKNPIALYATGIGAGVYVADGAFIVTGDVEISKNYTGTVSGGLQVAPTTGLTTKKMYGYVKLSDASVTLGDESNVYMDGLPIQAYGLTDGSEVGFTMNAYEGVFAHTDRDYYATGVLKPDGQVAEGVSSNLSAGQLRLTAESGSYRVGYGAFSIHPTDQDIANGIHLNGYGNTSFESSREDVRFTRYWEHGSKPKQAPTPARDTIVNTWQELMATAIAITDAEGDTVILINADLSSIGSSIANRVKSMVSRATGVPQNNITISCTHQHSGPSVATYYWQDLNGNYTAPVDTTTGVDEYADLYNGRQLELNEPRQIRSNYAATFYTGVVQAAVNAMNDRLDATVEAGILNTKSENVQYNFVRNIAIYKTKDANGAYKEFLGVKTDNHNDVSSLNPYYLDYETEIDSTMQLVRFTREGVSKVEGSTEQIILANFQTHPHRGGGSDNLNITADVVGAFRTYMRQKSGANVLYFSGASGNVNTGSGISGGNAEKRDDTILDPCSANNNGTKVTAKPETSRIYGDSLSTLANGFLSNAENLTPVNGGNVEVSVQTFKYQVWNEEDDINDRFPEEDEFGRTAYERLVAKAALLVNWESGGYKAYPSHYGSQKGIGSMDENGNYTWVECDKNAEGAVNHWDFFVGTTNGIKDRDGDEIYSFYHASKVRTRYLRKLQGNMSGTFEISAYDLGGIGFVAAPYEMFQESGQAIKGNVSAVTGGTDYVNSVNGVGETSPYAFTIVASQANGAEGYIPSRVGYDHMGYSTETSLFAPGTGEQLVQAYVDMLQALHAQGK